MNVQREMERGVWLQQAGRLAEAEAVYRQILTRDPNNGAAVLLLGTLAVNSGRVDEGIGLFREVLVRYPESPDAHYNLGSVLQSKGQNSEAIGSFLNAVRLRPGFVDAHNNLGIALAATGKLDESVAAYRAAIRLKPDYAEAHYNLGISLQAKGQLDRAAECYRRAIALNPKHALGHSNLGNLFLTWRRLDQAVPLFRKAVSLDPNAPVPHYNLGLALQRMGQFDEAIVQYREALRLRPTYPDAWNNFGNALKEIGQLDEAIEAYRQAVRLAPDFNEAHDNLLFTLLYVPGQDPQTIRQEHESWARQHAEPLKKFVKPNENDRDPERRLRIGYISPDLREHPVGRFLLPLLGEHDRRAFEIHCYAEVAHPDETTAQLQACTDRWRFTVGLTDQQAADLIRRDGIDILVDLAGHTGQNRLLVLARQPAPVQVSYMGYPATTGLSAIGYRITDALCDSPGMTESLHSEQLIRLPKCDWCCPEPPYSVPVAGSPALSTGRVTFGSFNNFAKINQPLLELWARILRSVPNSRIYIKAKGLGSEAAQARLRKKMEDYGIELERLELRAWVSSDEHLARYNEVDIALDTYPYHGTTTTCDAMWMGVPVVTLAGDSHVSRVGVSLLTNAGLAQLIAQTPDEYVKIAAELAGDLPRLAELRSKLREQMRNSPLMDADRFARDMEAAYRTMWRQWCGKSPIEQDAR